MLAAILVISLMAPITVYADDDLFALDWSKPETATGVFIYGEDGNIHHIERDWFDYRIYRQELDMTDLTMEVTYSGEFLDYGHFGFFAGVTDENFDFKESSIDFYHTSSIVWAHMNAVGRYIEQEPDWDILMLLPQIHGLKTDGENLEIWNVHVGGLEWWDDHTLRMEIRNGNVKLFYDDVMVVEADDAYFPGNYAGFCFVHVADLVISSLKINGVETLRDVTAAVVETPVEAPTVDEAPSETTEDTEAQADTAPAETVPVDTAPPAAETNPRTGAAGYPMLALVIACFSLIGMSIIKRKKAKA